MTFTRLTLGEPRLKGVPRGTPVEEACVDAVTEGTIIDTSFEETLASLPGWYEWNTYNGQYSISYYPLPRGSFYSGFEYVVDGTETAGIGGTNSSNPVFADSDTAAAPGLSGSFNTFPWWGLSDKLARTGSWALVTIPSNAVENSEVGLAVSAACPEFHPHNGYTAIVLSGHVITATFYAYITNYGSWVPNGIEFQLRVIYEDTSGNNNPNEAIPQDTVGIATQGAWVPITLSTVVPVGVVDRAYAYVFIHLVSDFASGSGNPHEEIWIDDLTVTVE